ncbi:MULTISPECIES: MFS transporter [Dictyoglomus]|jgi:MFS family permease|uniref:Major facilitator superfamily MFS_1 n=1 Tax=Dictyoglomus turgidum (strain DSM 6724 / Z-1310) TaxID=515635 RepID=B8E1C4_DICTD|nr:MULTISPECIES: MFS transporter [Dictyoglomus]ACK42252.1 major facilitator superfamily MFS_1 [Dictyoglomus turgidum DSM 6724]PNV80567.1 MAG: MFS transporter [Dictyoglomus turgidum]HBU32483.1 MFS transporter [Dictyoglomus sp.]
MWNVIITGITSFLTDVSSEMFYPLISFYLLALGAGPAILGIVEGLAESIASLLKVYSGYVSDKIRKRKPITILGYSLSAIGKLFLYFANSWIGVFIGRISDRFGKGIRTAPRDALIAESVPENRGRAFGLHRTMDTLGAFLGVLLSILIIKSLNLPEASSNLSSYIPTFKTIILISLIPAILGVLVLFLVKETTPSRALNEKKRIKFQWKALDRKLKGFLIISLIFTLGNSSNQFLFLRSQNLGASLLDVLFLYLLYNLVYTIFSYPAGFLSDKIGRKRIIILGYIFYGLVYFGFGIASKFSQLWLLFTLYGLYTAFTEGVEKALISDLSPAHLRATVIGLHATLVGIGLFPASFIAGLLWSILGPQAPFIFGGIMGIGAAIGLMFIL